MTLSLRERRRQETARHIQKATLELAMLRGLENVTTEDIAVASGVSTRTFFNYFANKEAAAIGHPPGFSEEDKEVLRHSTTSLTADLKLLLDKQISAMAEDEELLRMVGRILRSNEKTRGILEGFLTVQRGDLADCLSHRGTNRHTAAALAKIVSDTIGGAIFLWEHEDDMTLRAALDAVWEGQIDASRMLSLPAD